jgi:hypothetical protein
MRTITIKQHNLASIPFEQLHHIAEELVQQKFQAAEALAQQQYHDEVARLEREYTQSHEAPSEVGFGDMVQMPQYSRAKLRYQAYQEAVKDIWIPRYKLDTVLLGVMPQIIAHIGNRRIPWDEVMTAEGKIDGKRILAHAFDFKSSDWEKGLYIFLLLDSRSAYLTTQYKGESRSYCSLVPLIPYAFKLNQSVPYSRWDRSTLHWVVNKSLCNLMLWEDPTPSREDLLHARELGLTYQSGPKTGQMRNPQSTYKLFATKGGPLEGYPDLVGSVLTQIWCAHPQNRTQYMILDPHNWDKMPVPLIEEALFVAAKTSNTKTKDFGDELPW